MKSIAKFLVAFLVCGLLFVGCDKPKPTASGGGGNASASSLKLAFVTNNASDFWKIAAAGVDKYEKEAGVQGEIKKAPKGKVGGENEILWNVVGQGGKRV